MIAIIGDWVDGSRKAFAEAEQHLIDTERYHNIYGTDDIINTAKVLDTMLFLNYKQQVNLMIHLLSYCDTAYMLKGWENNNDVRLLHDYAENNNYRIIYSKKF